MRIPICMRALAASFALALLGGVGWPGVARAGQYHVYSCRMPDGEVAPTDGWSGSVGPGGAWDDYALDTCAEGGALVAALGDLTIHAAEVDWATWGFAAAPDTTIASATVWRAGYAHGQAGENATYQLWLTGADQTAPFDECIYSLGCTAEGEVAEPLATTNRVVVPANALGPTLYVNTNCGVILGHNCQANAGDAKGYAAALYVFAADITLEQAEGPHASGVSGELTSAPTLRGSSDVAFDATDPGAGVWQALFSVDGRVVQRTSVNDNGGRCREVGQTSDGQPAFLYVQPCAQSVSVDVPFDSTQASNGAHRLVVSVIDAAGNAAPVLDRTVTIDNPPPPGAPNGTNASAQARLSVGWRGTAKATSLGGFDRARSLAGRLTTAGGAPIGGAAVELRVTPFYAGAQPLTSTLHTDAGGRFALTLPAGTSSRTLRFAYRAHFGDRQPAATGTLRLLTRAGIALRVSPSTASVRRTIHFRGLLRGGPIPRGGKQLVLEARSPGSGWIEFKVIRTDARGRYRAAYRFKFAGPADYRFRVRSEAESDYPFAAGSSNVVRVHER
ncbi:MAG TPA: hypothetical protein VN672_06170 [Solirubrobacteraceae bacterium]|nr:hypothetical protein [Solirubrobacteraceae bacterium]